MLNYLGVRVQKGWFVFIGQLFFVLLASWFLVIYFRLWEPYEKPKLKTFIYFLTSHHIQEKKSRCHCITSRKDWGLVNMTITETDVHPLYYRYLSTKSLYRVVNEREQPASHSHLTDKKKLRDVRWLHQGPRLGSQLRSCDENPSSTVPRPAVIP